MRAVRNALSVVAISLVAACASDTTPTSPVTLDPATPALDRVAAEDGAVGADHRHVFELRNSPGVGFARPRAGSGTGISYHGGPVLTAGTNVAAIYWAGATVYSGGPTPGTTGSGAADGSLIGFFLRNLGPSRYFNINATYTNGSGVAIANLVSYTQFWANYASAPSGTQSVSDGQMVAMLQSGFTGGQLTYDPNTLYLIFTSGAVNLGGGFGTQYCAYHTHGTVTINGASRTVLYAAMPYDAAYPSACTVNATPNGDFGADAEVNTLAHEIEETSTDMMGNAWFDTRGYENADKCAWTFGSTFAAGGSVANIVVGGKNFMVQQNWVNAGSGGCIQQWP